MLHALIIARILTMNIHVLLSKEKNKIGELAMMLQSY